MTQTLRWLPLVVLVAACGDSTTPTDSAVPDSTADGTAAREFGAECEADAQCGSGICWDFNDSDPLCGGTACSIPCDTDAQCEEAAHEAGSTNPSAATCGSDGECSPVGAGLGGAFFCA